MFGQISLLDGGNPLKIDKPIRLIELCAGIGAQAKALENLGIPFEHYRICEFDKYAVRSYNAVHGTLFETSDITMIHAEDLCVCDTDKYTYIMTYSFPCTDLSSAGKQAGMSRGSGTRSGLLWQVERLLKEMDELPQILLMENVPEVVSDKNIKDFAEWIAFLDSLGYRSKYEILNAKNYRVPQNRERCFMVSWLGDYYFDFPEPMPLEIRLKDVLEPVVDEKYYLSDEQVAKLKLSSDFVARERERETCRAIRTGGHGSTDRHAWDIVLVDEPQRDRQSDGYSVYSDGAGLQGLWQSDDDGRGRIWGGTDKIVVAGSLNPEKEVQDRVRVLSPNGICQGLRATDYKDPPKILWADGIYLQCTEQFQRGPLNGLSRAIKATQHDAGVVLYGDD